MPATAGTFPGAKAGGPPRPNWPSTPPGIGLRPPWPTGAWHVPQSSTDSSKGMEQHQQQAIYLAIGGDSVRFLQPS